MRSRVRSPSLFVDVDHFGNDAWFRDALISIVGSATHFGVAMSELEDDGVFSTRFNDNPLIRLGSRLSFLRFARKADKAVRASFFALFRPLALSNTSSVV